MDINGTVHTKKIVIAALLTLCLGAFVGCDPGVPEESVGPAYGADPAYSTCQTDPSDVTKALCVNADAYSCVTAPLALGYGCSRPAPVANPRILCCPSIVYDADAGDGGSDAALDSSPVCESGYADCDGDPANGCETLCPVSGAPCCSAHDAGM